jgi:SAM dependent carboxyl methyltransferase
MQSDSFESGKSTEGMVDYDHNSAAQQRLVRFHAERIHGLVDRLGHVRPEMKIVDYGCGPGTSAIDAVKPAIEAYRARFPKSPISVCHADQPGNDWNGLFALAAGPSGYLADATAIRTEAAIGSFYERMAAEGSVALGTSFAASHWLSHAVRLHAPGTVWFADLTGDARASMAAVAQRDWTRFLHCRAAELRPGGFLLVSTLGATADDSEINGAAASGRGIYRAIQCVAQEMADEGLIDRAILDGFIFGLWFMTENEARAPLESDAMLAKAFTIEHLSVEPAPVNPSDIFAGSIGDPAEYARRYVGYTRAFGDSSLRTQLFEPSAGSAADTERLAQEFYRRLETLYQTSGEKYACEVWYLTVVLRRS